MKSFLLVFALLLFTGLYAQDYKKEWEKVMEYETDGKMISAAGEVAKIYNRAKKDKNEAQVIKTFFFSSKYMQVLEEDAHVKIVKNLRSEIKTASPATKALLENIYGEVLKDYYSYNRYLIEDRTNTDNSINNNFLTWTSKDFKEAIAKAYKNSIENRELLYNTPLDKYRHVLDYNLMSPETYRSLYDFLLERYFTGLTVNTRTTDQLENIDIKILFGDTESFIQLKTDGLKDDFKDFIVLAQQTEKFYTAKKDTLSLYRATLRRLMYIDKYVSLSEKDSTYIKTLENFIQTWRNSPFVYHAKLRLAQLYQKSADKKLHPDYNVKALELCDNIIANSLNTDAAPMAIELKNSVINQTINIVTEDHVLPSRPMLAYISYKNIDSVKISIYKIAATGLYTKEDYETIIKNKKPILEKTYMLPGSKNYFSYSTEVIIPPLSSGRYLIAVNDTTGKNNEPYYNNIYVSQIALVEQDNYFNSMYQVVNRETGAPVTDATMMLDGKVIHINKDAKTIVNPVIPKTFNPNAKPAQKSNNELNIMAIHKTDTITTKYYNDFNRANYKNDYTKDFPAKTQLFLDRAIYRPNQTLFFKGILTRRTKKGIETVPDVFVSITINDANDNKLESFRLKTNEFGSFTGEFTLPKNILTGEFSINVDEDENPEKDSLYNKQEYDHPFWDDINFESTSLYFKVEEYKRPTFTTTFDEVKKDFRLNDNAIVTGIAKSYSGAPIAGAKVTYNVRRTTSIMQWAYNNDHNESIDIVNGEAITDAEGKFLVDFLLESDKNSNKKDLPVFTYHIYASVTDINGESHNARTSMKAGYHSLELEANIPPIINPKSKNNAITLNSTNLNDEFLPVNGTVTIYKIAPPDKIYKERPWAAPEIQTIPEAEFTENFPYIPYRIVNNDTVIYTKSIYTKQVYTANIKTIDLQDFTGWPSGEYELIFTAKDAANNVITTKKRFSFVRDTDTYLPDNKIFTYEVINKNFSKDGFIAISLRTSLPQLYVNVAADYIDNSYDNYVLINKGKTIVKIPVSKIAREVQVTLNYIWQNKTDTRDFRINIPEINNDLIITATSINNKLQPGGRENWIFTVAGDKKLTSEVLASMYDASLDQFATESWYFEPPRLTNNYWPSVPYRRIYGSNMNIHADSYNYNTKSYIKNFEHRLHTYGFNINYSQYGIDTKSMPANVITRKGSVVFISGTVSDGKDPVAGLVITIKDIDQSAITDLDGQYTIPVKLNDILVFSDFGYISKEVKVLSDKNIDIVLDKDPAILEEIEINRYRNTTVKTTTAAITTISVEAIEERANANILQSLQGQIAGLNISTGSGQPGADSKIILRGIGTINGNIEPLFIIDGLPVDEDGFRSINQNDIASFSTLKDAAATSIYGNRGANGVILITTKKGRKDMDALLNVQARKNFNETAFFYPQLTTDKKGNINVSFTTPESLTEWKLRLLAHNKKGVSGYFESLAVTQKDLMVVPNMPRFLREKDTIVITAKITNITPEAKTGNAVLQLFDALTMQPADAAMMNTNNIKKFTLTAKGSTTVSWKIAVPQGMQAVQYKVLAKAGNFTDGEENILPVLTNNILVTESLPLWVRENSKKEYTFNNLKNNTSATLRNHQVTLEYTSNPAWLAIQSLPYLMEYEHECTEQVFARYYANAIATDVVNSNPKIAEVFAAWREKGKTLSKLEENEELKSVIATESPWLQDVQSEEERKNRIALLFDLEKMKFSLDADLQKLNDKQMASGGFPWFDGGTENEFITRHVLAGLGHLRKAGIDSKNAAKTEGIIKKAIAYTDARFIENYKKDEKNYAKRLSIAQPYSVLHYLYTRSFYIQQYPLDTLAKKAITKYLDYTKNNWLKYTLYEKGIAALALHRFDEKETAAKVITSLKETAANNTDSGMYWIENKPGWYWHQAPIETQALLIEAFSEIINDTKAVDEMKVWLLKQKQAKSWPTTKATTEAVYALLSKGTNWLSVKEDTAIQLGNSKILAQKLSENEKEAGTGYMKLTWKPEEITKDMATLSIENKSGVPGYGGFYWQYFEDLDKIKPAQEGIMNISKELYLKKNTAAGPELKKITAGNIAKTGDLVTVRLVLKVTEDMEYVHLKDLRASAFEPVDVLSKYEWKDGLGFYRSTKDAATHYFFDKINKGTYILEYDVRVNNAGEFSGGISTLQSMYAPEFSGHSKGMRVKTE